MPPVSPCGSDITSQFPLPLRERDRVRGAQLCDQKGQDRLKFGVRFSRSEDRPSRTSGPVKPSISSASEASKVGPAIRSQLLRLYLVHRRADCDPRARRRATSSALSASSGSSTQSETRPILSASSPLTSSHSSR